MALRKDVFQSKVLQKLYPAAPKPDERIAPHVAGGLAKNLGKRKECTTTGDAGKTQRSLSLGRRMYTVLPPPADYKADLEKSITLSELESIKSDKDPADDSNEESDQAEEEGQKRKWRRRKKKSTLCQDSGRDGAAPVSESSTGQSGTPVDEGGEYVSKNKKRKLKKKRHKEKLHALGMMPRAAALEFTYQKDVEEDNDDEERRAAEVSDFLRTIMKIYTLDSSLHVDELRLRSETIDDLLNSIAGGCKPTSVLRQLYSLKTCVQQKEKDKLEEALKELPNTSSLSAEETAAVISLLKYWITDVLPVHGDKKTELSTMLP